MRLDAVMKIEAIWTLWKIYEVTRIKYGRI